MAIIATKGTLDWAYPPFILASTAAALGWNVDMFSTVYGLLLLKKDLAAEVSPLGNSAIPMTMLFAPKCFQEFSWPLPNLLMAGVPGFEKLATGRMKKPSGTRVLQLSRNCAACASRPLCTCLPAR